MTLNRWQEEKIKDALQNRRVAILSGSRQCGKTTISKRLVLGDAIYRTLDDVTLRKAAQADANGFVKHTKGTMIIDEIQKVPELITAIKMAVDNDTRYGQFLITGSVNIQTLPTVKESLAGRVKKVRLRPFTQGEVLQNKPNFINRLLNLDFIDNTDYDKENTLNIIFRGGFPEAVFSNNEKERTSWYRDYTNTILEADLKDITNIKRQDSMKELISIIASFSSKFIDKSDITAKLGISKITLDTYINVLEQTYLIDVLPPWLKSDYERINKQNKYFMTDTGLMSSILHWNYDNVFLDSDKSGKITETFVYNELIAQVELQDGEYDLYHYRDREKREIDFILENNDKIVGIEVKSGSTLNSDMFKHLRWFKKNMVKDKGFVGIVLYTGQNVVSFGENLYAVPINNLWE
jgi:hypothetical protein